MGSKDAGVGGQSEIFDTEIGMVFEIVVAPIPGRAMAVSGRREGEEGQERGRGLGTERPGCWKV